MLYTSLETLLKEASQNPYPVYLIHSAQSFKRQETTKRLIAKVYHPVLDEFNFQRFDGGSLNVQDLSDAVEALPMMIDRKCVVVDGLDVEGLPAEEYKKLQQVLEDPPETCVLILTVDSTDLKKSSRFQKLTALAEKKGAVVALGDLRESDWVKFARDRGKKLGCAFEKDALERFCALCPRDMQAMEQELEKLALYSAGEPVTVDMVEDLTTKDVQARAFDLAGHLLSHRPERAFESLQALLNQKQPPVAILGALASTYVDLYRAKAARQAGKGQEEIVQAFDYKRKEFRVQNALRSQGRYSLEMLRQALEILNRCDLRLKGDKTDPAIILEQAMAQLLLLH